MLEEHLQHLELGSGHTLVIHELGVPQALQPLLEGRTVDELARETALGEVRHGLHVDVQHAQGVAAGRAVGAGPLGLMREQRVQRVQAHEGCALPRHGLQQALEVGEITDAPVLAGAQRIQLHTGPPQALTLLEGLGLVTGGRANDDAGRCQLARVRPGGLDGEPVVAQAQIERQVEVVRHHLVFMAWGCEQHPVKALPPFADQGPGAAPCQPDRQRGGLALAEHQHCGQDAVWCFSLQARQGLEGLFVAVDRQAHGLQQLVQRGRGHFARMAPEVVVACGQAHVLAQRLDGG